jgi:hypothetical protein
MCHNTVDGAGEQRAKVGSGALPQLTLPRLARNPAMLAKKYFSFDGARKHKAVFCGPFSRVIWVEDAGEYELAVLHWMGGGYKVIERYKSDQIAEAKAHGERCQSCYCQSEPGDNEAFLLDTQL